MHARNRTAVDPRTPTVPGRVTSAFQQQVGIACAMRETR